MVRVEEEIIMLPKLWLPYPVDSAAIHWNLEADVEEGGDDMLTEDLGICICRSGIQSRDLKFTYIRLCIEKKKCQDSISSHPIYSTVHVAFVPCSLWEVEALVTNLIHVSEWDCLGSSVEYRRRCGEPLEHPLLRSRCTEHCRGEVCCN